MLDLGVDDLAVVADRGERADEAVDEHACRAPMIARAADDRVDDLSRRPRSRRDPRASTPRRPCRRPRLERLEHEPVALEQRVLLAGVDPPAVEHLVAHPVTLVDQPLDGVGDLELAPRATARSPRTASWIVRVEQVDADQREVATADRSGFSTRRTTSPSRVELGDAEALRVGDVGEQDLRAAARSVSSRLAAARSASNASTNAARSCCSRLSPRYMTKSSSPRKSRAISTQWARPSGASCGM